MATIEALQDEFSRELAALNVRVDALEAELAVVRGMADQNAKDIAKHKIKTEDIEPLEERVGVLEVEHDEKIAGIWDDLNRFRSCKRTFTFQDIDVHGEIPVDGEGDPALSLQGSLDTH